MIEINTTDNYFDYVRKAQDSTVVVYGAGNITRDNIKHLGHIDYICDQRAEQIGSLGGIECILPERLCGLGGRLIILICVFDKAIVDEICMTLEKMQIAAELFYFFDNPAFSFFHMDDYRYRCSLSRKLKICIVYKNDGWIFGKFANMLQAELKKMGYEAKISQQEDLEADINHYISYGGLYSFLSVSNTVRTTMITHIDCTFKMDLIKYQAEHNATGICMSLDTMNKLVSWGVPRDKVCYVNPAQDGDVKPRKIVLGITNRCYHNQDFRKRDDLIVKVCERLNADFFKIKIMGSGWEDIIKQITGMGFEVEYHSEFDRTIYKDLISSLDYWIYYGFDEGAMGYLDALAAGVKTIATPQGYHLDTKCKVTFPCSTIDDFARTLQQIENEKKEIVESVKAWTWENYARKHLEIWHYLTKTKPLSELYVRQNEYTDGIFSMLVSDIAVG